MAETTSAVPIAVASPRRGFLSGKARQEQIVRIIATTLCIMGVLIILFPLGWMISTSLKTKAEGK